MNPSESIYKLLHAHWQGKKAGCECGGSGLMAAWAPEASAPCPSCARIDALMEKWEYLGWPIIWNMRPLTQDLTGTEWTVLCMLRDAGLWEGFSVWLSNENANVLKEICGQWRLTEILTNGEYLCQSVESFLTEVVHGG